MSCPPGGRFISIGLGCVLFAALLALQGAPARAQGSGVDQTGNGGKHSIRGRIFFPSGRRVDTGLRIRLESTGFGDITVVSDANGSFRFQSLRPGSYYVVVEGGDEFETYREPVTIESDSSMGRGSGIPSIPRPYTVQVYLQPKISREPTVKPGVLNAALAGVPKPAVELYNKALESARAGEDEKAAQLLRAALQVHQDFALALSKLGVIYMKMKQPEKAVEPLRAALRLTPDDYPTLLTYGSALYTRQQFPEAEEQFRKAVQKNNSSPSGHYYLGLIALKRQDLEAAEKEMLEAIRLGRGELPIAHKYLGGIYWGRKDYQRAAEQLETYLRLVPNAEDAARLRATVKELRGRK
jgi:Tfp pilus assembly protein PilF